MADISSNRLKVFIFSNFFVWTIIYTNDSQNRTVVEFLNLYVGLTCPFLFVFSLELFSAFFKDLLSHIELNWVWEILEILCLEILESLTLYFLFKLTFVLENS